MKKILVIQNKRIGDVLIASVLANNLKQQIPHSHITYFVYDYTAGVLENNPNIDRIITVKDKELKKLPFFWKVLRKVRKERYDIIVDPYAKFQSRMMCYFSGAPQRVGFKRQGKKLKLKFYTHEITFLDQSPPPCGKALADRLNLLEKAFGMKDPDPHYKVFLTEAEKKDTSLQHLSKPIVMMGVLGSTPSKSLPYGYTAQLIDFLTEAYSVSVLFNYAPYQKEEAKKIFELCKHKEKIHWDIYADSIRGYCIFMNQCDLLISNEGGSVHIAKALKKPTFTIYSPFITKSHWNSFEDGTTHASVHLFDDNPDYFERLPREQKKEIEKAPEELYQKLTPEMILQKLKPYLEHHLTTHKV